MAALSEWHRANFRLLIRRFGCFRPFWGPERLLSLGKRQSRKSHARKNAKLYNLTPNVQCFPTDFGLFSTLSANSSPNSAILRVFRPPKNAKTFFLLPNFPPSPNPWNQSWNGCKHPPSRKAVPCCIPSLSNTTCVVASLQGRVVARENCQMVGQVLH